MTPAIRIRPFARDLRCPSLRAAGAALAQEQADLALEREWRRRVAENIRKRAARGKL
jgi:hypothetical protein